MNKWKADLHEQVTMQIVSNVQVSISLSFLNAKLNLQGRQESHLT